MITQINACLTYVSQIELHVTMRHTSSGSNNLSLPYFTPTFLRTIHKAVLFTLS